MRKHDWNKYEVKDSSRSYWSIFFRPVNVEESKKNLNPTPGSEGYFDLGWSYFVLCNQCTAKLEKMTEKQILKLSFQDGVFNGHLEWEAHIDHEEFNFLTDAPSPEMFLKDFHNDVTAALMAACSGNIIENSVDKEVDRILSLRHAE